MTSDTTAWVTLAGHFAWPFTALILAFVLIYQIRHGLLLKLMEGLSEVRAGPFTAKKEAVEKEAKMLAAASTNPSKNEIPKSLAQFTNDESIVAQSPYDIIQDLWTDIAELVTDIAVQHGGVRDQRKVQENIILLRNKDILEDGLMNLIRAAQQFRNSVRRSGPGNVTSGAASEYMETANNIIARLREKVDFV